MIDITGSLQSAIRTALLTDTGVMQAFPAFQPRVFDVPPTNAQPPYVTIGQDDLVPLEADGFSLSEIDCTVHVWSLTQPAGFAEAKTIAAAVGVALLALASNPDFTIYASDLRGVRYLLDPSDGRTAHAIITIRFTASPA